MRCRPWSDGGTAQNAAAILPENLKPDRATAVVRGFVEGAGLSTRGPLAGIVHSNHETVIHLTA